MPLTADDSVPGCLRVQLLGPVRAWRGGTEVPLGAGRQRGMLALLALAGGRPIPRDELVQVLWGEDPPASATNILHTYVKSLRRALETERRPRQSSLLLPTIGTGYALAVESCRVDALAFRQLVAAARAQQHSGEPGSRLQPLREALALWQGPPLADVPGLTGHPRFGPLVEERWSAVGDYIDEATSMGRAGEVLSLAEEAAQARSLDEQSHARLIRVYRLSGRRADGFAVYHRIRRRLVESLGVDPGAELTQAHRDLLQHVDTGDAAKAQPSPRSQRTQPAAPAQLPPDVSAFTGRDDELERLDGILADGSNHPAAMTILAITGTAGVGKTALAVHWAHRVRARFPDGQLYVTLRGYDPDRPVSAADALAGFLHALGVVGDHVPAGAAERVARFRSAVADRRILMVLDNASSVEQIRPLLPGTSSCVVVVTSRDSLPGLVARDGAHRVGLDVLPFPDAITLLRRLIGDRVGAEGEAAAALADRCVRLPLALRVAAELAVARPFVTLRELAGELAGQQARLERLDAGGDAWSNVAAVLSWSIRHLPPHVAHLFGLLGLHPGPDFDSYAAAAAAATSLSAARRSLDSLARAHLIHPARHGRYGMHDLHRAYATSLATAKHRADDPDAALDRMFDHYLATAAAAMDHLHPADAHHRPRVPEPATPAPVFGDRDAARTWLDTERSTLIAVAAHTATHGRPAHAIRLSTVLFRYYLGGYHADALTVHDHALRAAHLADDLAGRAQALTHLGATHLRLGRNASASGHLQRALHLFRQAHDATGEARALTNLGDVDQRLGHYRSATERHQRALDLYRSLDDRAGEAHALTKLGIIEERLGRYPTAIEFHRQALALFRQTGDDPGEAAASSNLGDAEGKAGRYGPAVKHLERALTVYRQTGNPDGTAWTLDNLGSLYARLDQLGRAARCHREALSIHRRTGERFGEACTLNGLGEVACDAGRASDAIIQHTAASTLATEIGDRHQQARAHAGLGHAYRAVGEPGRARHHFQSAWAIYTRLGTADADRIREHLTGTHPPAAGPG